MKKSLLTLLACLCLTSCFKDGCDFADLDTTMQVTTDTLWTPASSTAEIPLSLIIDAGEVLRRIEGEDGREFYALRVDNNDANHRDGKYTATMKLVNAGNTTLSLEDREAEHISIGSLPEFLRNERTVLDLDNPALLLLSENHLPCDVLAKLRITGYDEHGKMQGEYPLNDCQLKAAPVGGKSVQKMYLADRPMEQLPSWLSGYTYWHTENLNDLVRNTPERIDVTVTEAELTNSDEVTLDQMYNLNLDFGFYAPLRFGPQFHVEYDYKTDSFSDDLDVVEDLEVSNVLVEGDIISTLPLDISFDFEARNAADQPIDGLTLVLIHDVKEGNTNHIRLGLLTAEGDDVMNYLSDQNPSKKLDHISVHAVCDAGQNEPQLLTTDMSMQVANLRLGVVNLKYTFGDN